MFRVRGIGGQFSKAVVVTATHEKRKKRGYNFTRCVLIPKVTFYSNQKLLFKLFHSTQKTVKFPRETLNCVSMKGAIVAAILGALLYSASQSLEDSLVRDMVLKTRELKRYH